MGDDPAENLKTLEAVLAIVSHDMRTPLSVVQTTTSMLLNPKYNLSPDQVREQHERIRRNVDLMNRMIGDVVDLVQLRSGKLSINPKSLEINDVLREAVAALEAPAREKELVLKFDAASDLMRADADRARLLQLFQNLLGNAIKFAKAGDKVQVSSHMSGGQAQMEIADSGPGIPPDDLPHIFDPYYSSNNEHKKTGMGLDLYIAKGIVDAHGGTIRCSSEPGTGTRFIITLPLVVNPQ